MKKVGRLVVTLVGVAALVGFCYRGPIKDLAKSFMTEVDYYYSIDPETAYNKPLNTDSDALTANIIGDITIDDNVEEPDWNMEDSAEEIFNEFIDKVPIVKDGIEWFKENVLKEGTDSEENVE